MGDIGDKQHFGKFRRFDWLEKKRGCRLKYGHDLDDDGVCVRCGWDGAEWHWWRYNTYEGMSLKTPAPECRNLEADHYEELNRGYAKDRA